MSHIQRVPHEGITHDSRCTIGNGAANLLTNRGSIDSTVGRRKERNKKIMDGMAEL